VVTSAHALFDKEMKYLHDNGFKVLLLNQIGYDTTHNTFFIKNSPAAADTAATRISTTTTSGGPPTIATTAIEKNKQVD
jgi:hypothetical protein